MVSAAAELEAGPRGRGLAARAAGALGTARRAARRWMALPLGLYRAVPAVAGSGLLSAAAGLRFGVWAGLAAAGVFCLLLDARL